MNEQCRDKAVERFMSDYRKKWGYFKVEDYNMDRHLLVKGAVNLYFLFKKQHFWSFSAKFPEFIAKFPEYKDSEGDSINTKALGIAVNNKCKFIVFAHKEDEYYYANPKELLEFCLENDLKRKQDISNSYKVEGGNRETTHEETFSFPLGYLDKWRFEE